MLVRGGEAVPDLGEGEQGLAPPSVGPLIDL
jgi:hypothetical protein